VPGMAQTAGADGNGPAAAHTPAHAVTGRESPGSRGGVQFLGSRADP
jgi:hypothetical protein